MTSHICHKDTCSSPAEFGVSVHLTCAGPGVKHVIAMKSSIEVCELHKDDVKGFVLSEKNMETIRDSLMDQGLPEPDFLSARFEFVPIKADGIAAVALPVAGCDRADCTNPAHWRVVQGFRTLAQAGVGPAMCEVMTNLNVCAKHKKAVKPADFLDKESRASTLAFLREHGMLLPDVDHPIIDFVELVGGEPEANKARRIIAQ